MKLLRRINFFLVTALSLTAAIPKIAQLPGEIEFFRSAGLGTAAVVVFGVLQLAAGALLVFRKTRFWGAAGAALAFLVSAGMLFLVGQIRFGAFSLIPVCMAGAVVFELVREKAQR